MPNGWIILDKPLGLGSTQAVAAVKRNLREAGFGKKVKVGHGGTLDPLYQTTHVVIVAGRADRPTNFLAPGRYRDSHVKTTGLTGFDMSLVGRACDPSCSDSLNGATQRIANEQFALAA